MCAPASTRVPAPMSPVGFGRICLGQAFSVACIGSSVSYAPMLCVLAPDVADRQKTLAIERPSSPAISSIGNLLQLLPIKKWIGDFSNIWTLEDWLQVAAVMDRFSRRLVGWSMKAQMTATLVADALIMAIWHRGKPDALRHHPDKGGQHQRDLFQRLMADNGVICSTSQSGNVWGNAGMERCFSSLKTDRIGRKIYRTRDQAKAKILDYN